MSIKVGSFCFLFKSSEGQLEEQFLKMNEEEFCYIVKQIEREEMRPYTFFSPVLYLTLS